VCYKIDVSSISFTKFKHVSLLISVIFLWGCSKGSNKNAAVGSPVPASQAGLTAVQFQDQGFHFKYLRGHTLSMTNTKQSTKAIVGAEPLAFLYTCRNREPIQPGEIRIQQYSYKASSQDGKELKLTCDRMPVSEIWLETFLDAFPQCLEKSLKAAELEKPESVIIHSVMIYMHKGKGQRLSLHAPGRAVDISKLELVYADKNREIIVSKANKKNNPSGGELTIERTFYTAFRRCWDENLVQKHGCNVWKKDGYRGSVGWEDSDHQNHIHLSRPFCPSDSNYLGG
jgi:hypothetical protein